jgi:hypothetical protein
VITFRPLDIHRDWPWVKDNVRCVLCEDTRGIIAERDGRIVAAFIMDSWTETSVQCHQAIHDPLVFKHGYHVKTAQYIFGDAGRKLMIGLTPSDNEKAIKLNKHYGFTESFRVPDAVREGVDYVVMTMTADECPYFGESNGSIPVRAA